MLLNAAIDISTVPPHVRRAFRTGRARRVFLPAGRLLYRFVDHVDVPLGGAPSPWWFSIDPLDARDPGLLGSLVRARRAGVALSEYMRARGAVTNQWNGMTSPVIARLHAPAGALAGECAHQRIDENEPKHVVFIGGAWQLYIPGLGASMIDRI